MIKNIIVSIIKSIIKNILNAYVMYNIFQKKSLRYAIFIDIIFSLLYFTYYNYGANLGILNSLLSLIIIILKCITITSVDYLVFRKTKKFISYLLLSIPLSSIAYLILIYIYSFITNIIYSII